MQPLCRSELAREKHSGAAFIQETRVIIDVFASKLAPTQGLHHCTSIRCTCNPNCSYACTSGASHSVISV